MSPIHLTFFITLAFLATSARAATDKAERMATDASVSTYERKAVINFAQVWIEDARVELPVTRCTIRKKKVEKEVENDDGEKETKVEVKKTEKCTSGGTWRAEMTEGWVQRNAAQHADILVTPRFDQILVGPSQLRLITPTSDSAADIDLFTYRPNYEVGNYRSFKREMLKSLNLLAPALREAQTVINSARYQELPDQEKGTFMAEQAKSAGIPLSVFERLSASTYAFAIYIPRVTGSIEVTKTIDTDKSVSHSISVDAPLDTKIIVFRFEGDSFSIDLERRYGRGFGSALGRQMAGSASTSTAFEPTRRDAQSLFQAAFNRSLSDSYIDLGNALKADRRFALQAPLGLGPDGFTFPLGVKDGIRARHPFRIYRTIDGKEKAVGRVRVNSVLNNCTEAKPSVLTRRGGSIEEFDLAVEEPYGGAFWGFSGGTTLLPHAADITGIRFGAHVIGDLAYLQNSPSANDWYLHLDTSLAGFGRQDESSDLIAGAEATIGFERRYYLPNSPIYFGLEPRIGFQYLIEDSNDDEIDREARIIVADGLTTFGIDFGLGMNIAAFAGLRAGAVIENTLSQDETMALQAMAGVSLSFSFGGSAGPFSLAYRAAEGCQK